MLTNVHQNSITAYNSDVMDSRTNKEMIIDYSLSHRHFTTTMLAVGIGKQQSTLRSKIDQLLATGELVKEIDSHPCQITGHNAQYYYNPKFFTPRLI
jgi:hypothetical protein